MLIVAKDIDRLAFSMLDYFVNVCILCVREDKRVSDQFICPVYSIGGVFDKLYDPTALLIIAIAFASSFALGYSFNGVYRTVVAIELGIIITDVSGIDFLNNFSVNNKVTILERVGCFALSMADINLYLRFLRIGEDERICY